jgi:hypothetical protein
MLFKKIQEGGCNEIQLAEDNLEIMRSEYREGRRAL